MRRRQQMRMSTRLSRPDLSCPWSFRVVFMHHVASYRFHLERVACDRSAHATSCHEPTRVGSESEAHTHTHSVTHFFTLLTFNMLVARGLASSMLLIRCAARNRTHSLSLSHYSLCLFLRLTHSQTHSHADSLACATPLPVLTPSDAVRGRR